MNHPTAPSVTVDRLAVLRARAAAHGLGREAVTADDVPLLGAGHGRGPASGLGVQDSPPGSARLALAARTAAPGGDAPDPARWEDDDRLRSAWSLRGAPHVHRRADLPALAAALWPQDDADATARLAWNATRVRATGRPALEVLARTAAAVAQVAALDPATLDATGLAHVERRDGEVGLGKGLLSREVSRRLPPELRRWCEPCQVEHVFEQALRLAALPGGLALDGTSPLVFGAEGPWTPPSAPGDLTAVVRAYLHLYGPATPGDVKTFLGSTLAAVTTYWPADAVPVGVATSGATRRAWALPDRLAALTDPPLPPPVRLLPPNDPLLKAGDRDVLVPDRGEQKAVWRVLGSPGVVLVEAVPAGIWRPRTSGGRLDLAVESFAPLPPSARRALPAEAERMAAVRGLRLGRLTL